MPNDVERMLQLGNPYSDERLRMTASQTRQPREQPATQEQGTAQKPKQPQNASQQLNMASNKTSNQANKTSNQTNTTIEQTNAPAHQTQTLMSTAAATPTGTTNDGYLPLGAASLGNTTTNDPTDTDSDLDSPSVVVVRNRTDRQQTASRASVPAESDADNSGEDTNSDISMSETFTLTFDKEEPNVITKYLKRLFPRIYEQDSKKWTPNMKQEFRKLAPTMNFAISATTNNISSNRINKNAKEHGATWVHFWFLRIMFGPKACSKQPWFHELAKTHPWILNEAPGGVVPADVTQFLRDSDNNQDWAPPTPAKETPDAEYTPRKRPADPTSTPASNPSNPKKSKTQQVDSNGWAALGSAESKKSDREEVKLLRQKVRALEERLDKKAESDAAAKAEATAHIKDLENRLKTLHNYVAKNVPDKGCDKTKKKKQ